MVVSCSVLNHNDEEFEEDLGKLVAAEEARMAAEVAASRETVQDTRQLRLLKVKGKKERVE